MGNLKLGKEQHSGEVGLLTKEKLKEAGRIPSVKNIKKQLPLPPSSTAQQHPPTLTVSQSLPSLFTIASSTSPTGSSSQSPFSALVPSLASSSSTSAPSVLRMLREILQNVTAQRNQIVALMNSIDPTFISLSCGKSMQEHKLLNQVSEIQGKILDINEEIFHMRAKNIQLEQQLNSLQAKRAAQV
ncbi:hypothetical protein KP509_28G028500 [Ceratopteris richardii]|uniref:Uncharacterized protein n=1 Tax=Ceratopteris richardii TaxID=49495 RepID=A0A8T2RDB1_CERRI|nr:hypothetical protein KP509_28G028500 [Ceratopteris richardii]KAH7293504.1 hypothetical protein KP509_28G028500 [Ceratopteris richardii]